MLVVSFLQNVEGSATRRKVALDPFSSSARLGRRIRPHVALAQGMLVFILFEDRALPKDKSEKS